MSTIPAFRCDICSAEHRTSPAATITYETGESEMDPSGNGYNHEVIRVDFCLACRNRALVEFVRYHRSLEEPHP